MHFDPKKDALRNQIKKEGINPDMIDESYGDTFEDFVDIVLERELNDNWDEYEDDSYEY
tara:strand:- start:9 stop:185 length:177 start_codon:yes stop_codon:yes gene_type:complete